ncbi:MAG: hypothetical protein ACI9VI_003527 [Candidatus Azotimanducaceae bacterium]
MRRQVKKDATVLLEAEVDGQQHFGFIDGQEDIKLYEYSVLITSLEDEPVSVFQHYRDRADCENVFDEMKNQWGWGGYTTLDLKSRLIFAKVMYRQHKRTLSLSNNVSKPYLRIAVSRHCVLMQRVIKQKSFNIVTKQ